jgi:hippurate hydrolase
MHNWPSGTRDAVSLCKGAAMAGAAFFDITIKGVGAHAAMPQQSRDTLVIACALVGQIQTIVARNVAPLDAAVVSVTQVHAGSAYNVVPETAALAGTIRYFRKEVFELAERRMRELCAGFATAFGVAVDADIRNAFDVLMNDPDLSDAYLDAARDVVGAGMVSGDSPPATGSEDFADMLQIVPGAYLKLGHAGEKGLHNPGFVLDPAILPTGASIYARIVERRLPLG